MKFSRFIIMVSVLLISYGAGLFINGRSIIQNTIVCSYSSNEINVQSTQGDINCQFLDKKNSSGICFNDLGSSCIPSSENNYSCSNLYFLTCIGSSDIACTSFGSSSCSILKKKFYGNGNLLNTNQFTFAENRSSASSVSPIKLISTLLFTILIILN